ITSDPDHVIAELLRIRLGHSDILSGRPLGQPSQLSPIRAAAPFEMTRFPLGYGLVHADAHEENMVPADSGWVLIDWDNACYGPRELDLVGTLPDHFHTPHTHRAEFVRSYDYDLLEWSSWRLLRDITEYHSLGSYIRIAADEPRAEHELRRRVESLRKGDRDVVWQSVS
ncbi:phosphotransferase family protein, partial [Nocardia nova]